MGGSRKSKEWNHIGCSPGGRWAVWAERMAKAESCSWERQVSLETVNNYCGVEQSIMGLGLGLPKLELSVKRRKSQESPGQGDPFCSVSQREWS